MSIIIIAVPESATATHWAEVHKALAITVGGSVVQSSPVTAPVQSPVQPASQPTSNGGKAPRAQFVKGSPEAKQHMAALRARKGSKPSTPRPEPVTVGLTATATERMTALASRVSPQPASAVKPEAAPKLDQAAQAAQDAIRFANVDAGSLSPEGYSAVADWCVHKLEAESKKLAVADFLDGECFLGSLASTTTARGKSNLALDIARKAGIAE